MKTENLELDGEHAWGITRGHRDSYRSGGTVLVTDSAGTETSTGHLILGSGLILTYDEDGNATLTGTSLLTVKDEGSSLATVATSIDFVGAGVVASGATEAKTVTVPGVTEANVQAVGHYELLMVGASPPEPLEDGTGTDWLYVWVTP